MFARFFIAVMTVAGVAACSQQSDNSQLAATIDSRGYDVTILQAWISDQDTAIKTGNQSDEILGASLLLDPSRCTDVWRDTQTTYSSVTADCTAELEEVAKLPEFDRKSPIINKAQFSYQLRHEDNAILTRSGRCELIEFRTVIRDVALNAPTFSGIGFHFSGYASAGEFIAKDRMHAVGNVILKDGAPATVHRFFARGMCFGTGGNGGSLYRRNYDFRPFAQYDADGNSHRIWDEVPTNYHLGRKDDGDRQWVNSFDRQLEILRP